MIGWFIIFFLWVLPMFGIWIFGLSERDIIPVEWAILGWIPGTVAIARLQASVIGHN